MKINPAQKKVPTPKVDVWAVDYGVKTFKPAPDTEEDNTPESKAILEESPAPVAQPPLSNEQPIVNPEPTNLQPLKKK